MLRFPAQWLNENPLTRADLEQEVSQLAKLDVKMEIE